MERYSELLDDRHIGEDGGDDAAMLSRAPTPQRVYLCQTERI